MKNYNGCSPTNNVQFRFISSSYRAGSTTSEGYNGEVSEEEKALGTELLNLKTSIANSQKAVVDTDFY
ncbi:hypothetical protein MN116_007327 [Schistosoma mekongi]|uniref:Uncharacterized protein n=1 Tax=Schistosoma mekongi TaxID=38744 RepID=A0AAE1Z9S9_SCHME|nr:hypothetical protein MN116_007327 [Schistosoma mekongi]